MGEDRPQVRKDGPPRRTGGPRSGRRPWATAALLALLPAAAALGAQEPAGAPPAAGPEPAAAAACSDREALARRLDALLDDPALTRAHVGLVVQVAESGELIYARAPEKRFVAASSAKLVTAAVALRRLGPDFRWRTRLAAAGQVRGDTLHGDLWVLGSGDPRLTRERVAGWPRLLREAGIRHIRGDVVGDDRAFEGPPWGEGWMWEDTYAGWGAGVSGLQLAPGRIRAEVAPGAEVGEPATLRALEPGLPLPVVNEARTGPPASELRLHFVPPAEGGPVRLRGWVPAGREPVPLVLAPAHPTFHFLEGLRAFLAEAGIGVDGRFRRPAEGETPAAETWSRDLPSEPLEAAVEELLKWSDNQVAESILRTLGRELRGAGTTQGGAEVARETLAEWGIEPGAVVLADGSGLSRYTQATPAALARLLRRAWQLPGFEALRGALPVAARDGTLSRRLEATAAEGNIRAKTGSLSGVGALAGYVTDADGETLVFSLLLNGYDAPGEVATALEDLLVEQLALYHGPDYPLPCP